MEAKGISIDQEDQGLLIDKKYNGYDLFGSCITILVVSFWVQKIRG